MSAQLEAFRRRLDDRTAAIGVAERGCAGLPLVVEMVRAVEQARFGFDTRYVTRAATHGRAKIARL